MAGIEANVLNRYIFKDNMYGHIPDPIEITSASQIQDYMYNRLVKVKRCHFKYPDVMFADGNGYATSNDIIFSDGSSIVLHTLAGATFASVLTPQDTFDMVALLSRFGNTNLLILRFLNDMDNFIAPGYKLVVSEMNLSQNPLNNGWINKNISGSSWEYIQGAAMRITGDTGDNDSWLISPAIDATAYDNLSISFTHRSLNGTANRQVYYSTTYTGGDINESEWHSLNVNSFTTNFTEYIFILPNELLTSSNVRIAFRYNDDTNSTWLLSSFKVFTIAEFK